VRLSALPSDSGPGGLCAPRYAPGVAFQDKVRISEIRRALNVELLLRIERTQLHYFGYVSRMPHERL